MNRRETLRLVAGALIGSAGIVSSRLAVADAGSFRSMTGDVRVGGQPVQAGTILKPGDTISTGKGATASFVVGNDAFGLREDTLVELGLAKGVATCRLEKGGVLFSVAKDRVFRTTVGTFDIGTGSGHIEVRGAETYFCLCYGDCVVLAASAPELRNAFLSDHHDRPVVVRAAKNPQDAMTSARRRGHTDAEIAALDALVGRSPPFAAKG